MRNFTWDQWRGLIVEYGAAVALSVGHVLLIVLIGWIAVRAARRALRKLESVLIARAEQEDFHERQGTERRIKTLTGLLTTVVRISIWAVVLVTSLTELGLNIGPILAGAGIAGLAVGFGAQNLVRDIIAGFFFIMENQVRVGDVAIINGTGGLVESISFRTISLRDLRGVVHIFPHGAVSTVSNMSKGWSAYVLDMGIAYKENPDEAIQVMREVFAGMRGDPEFASRILEDIEIFGVDSFGDSAVVVKMRIKTVPLQQWSVGREFNRRLKHAFDARGIEIPFPHRTVYFPDEIRTAVRTKQEG